jgi:hypothetical protein
MWFALLPQPPFLVLVLIEALTLTRRIDAL